MGNRRTALTGVRFLGLGVPFDRYILEALVCILMAFEEARNADAAMRSRRNVQYDRRPKGASLIVDPTIASAYSWTISRLR